MFVGRQNATTVNPNSPVLPSRELFHQCPAAPMSNQNDLQEPLRVRMTNHPGGLRRVLTDSRLHLLGRTTDWKCCRRSLPLLEVTPLISRYQLPKSNLLCSFFQAIMKNSNFRMRLEIKFGIKDSSTGLHTEANRAFKVVGRWNVSDVKIGRLH